MIFKVIDTRTNREPIFDHNHLFREKWFKESHLIWCDISGWGIDEDGNLFLADDCDNIAYPPKKRFRVEFDFDELIDFGFAISSRKYSFHKNQYGGNESEENV